MQIYTIQWIYLSVYSFLNGDFILLQTYKPRIMNWKQLISNKRFGLEELHEARKDDRSEFQRDYDRLIFSAPFRRLQNKTQVFPLPGSIFVHNRLTHSLEVSCVGRSLGNDVASRLLQKHPELADSHISEIGSIVSAACLAHDLGNPPFGHSGEKAISTYFSEGKGIALKEELSSIEWDDLIHFEGNANAFRLLTHQFEGRRKGGFVMTYSTLASIVKYPFLHVWQEKIKVRLLSERRSRFPKNSYRVGNHPAEPRRRTIEIRPSSAGLSGRSSRRYLLSNDGYRRRSQAEVTDPCRDKRVI